MNVFIHELKAYRRSTIIWAIALSAIAMLFLSFYPAFSKDTTAFEKVMENYPPAVQKAFGINFGSFMTILGFYCFPLSFITLCGAIQAMNLGTSIVSKEVREKTADFLLTKPITRAQVLCAKLLAAFVSLVITNIIYLAAASFMAFQVKTDDFSYKVFVMLSLTMFFIQLIFLAIGFLVSVLARKLKSVLSVSLAVVFALYFVGVFSDTTNEEAKRYLSPFKYFDNTYILKHASYEGSFLIAGAVIMILAILFSYIVYIKKDIHAV